MSIQDSKESLTCPHCGAPRQGESECARCGIIFAKVHAQLATPFAAAASAVESARTGVAPIDPEERTELLVRIVALPLALFVAWLLVNTSLGHALVRTFFGMWVHESGHAVTAWFCGFHAVPGPWFTPIAESRSFVFALMFSAAIIALMRFGWRAKRSGLVVFGAAALLLQLVGTVMLSLRAANALVLFGGDGGCLVLGSALMMTLYVGEDSPLRTNRCGLVSFPLGHSPSSTCFRPGGRPVPTRTSFHSASSKAWASAIPAGWWKTVDGRRQLW